MCICWLLIQTALIICSTILYPGVKASNQSRMKKTKFELKVEGVQSSYEQITMELQYNQSGAQSAEYEITYWPIGSNNSRKREISKMNIITVENLENGRCYWFLPTVKVQYPNGSYDNINASKPTVLCTRSRSILLPPVDFTCSIEKENFLDIPGITNLSWKPPLKNLVLQEMIKYFQLEIDIEKLSSPNIIKTFNIKESTNNKHTYLIQEYKFLYAGKVTFRLRTCNEFVCSKTFSECSLIIVNEGATKYRPLLGVLLSVLIPITAISSLVVGTFLTHYRNKETAKDVTEEEPLQSEPDRESSACKSESSSEEIMNCPKVEVERCYSEEQLNKSLTASEFVPDYICIDDNVIDNRPQHKKVLRESIRKKVT